MLIGNIFIGVLLLLVGIVGIFRLSTFSRKGVVIIGYKGTSILSFAKATHPVRYYISYTAVTFISIVMTISGVLFLLGIFNLG